MTFTEEMNVLFGVHCSANGGSILGDGKFSFCLLEALDNFLPRFLFTIEKRGELLKNFKI